MQQEIQPNSATNSFKTAFLLIAESFLTLILRFDGQLRKRAYPLATDGSLIAIRSYLPYDEIYLTFNFKGLLLDSEMPPNKEKADVIVNAHSFEIIQAILSNNKKTVDKLQILGDEKQVALFKEFLYQLSINAFIENSIKQFTHKPTKNKDKNQDAETEDKKKKQQTNEDYQIKYRELNAQYYMLKNENKRLDTHRAELESQKDFYTMVAIFNIVFGIAIGLSLGWYFL